MDEKGYEIKVTDNGQLLWINTDAFSYSGGKFTLKQGIVTLTTPPTVVALKSVRTGKILLYSLLSQEGNQYKYVSHPTPHTLTTSMIIEFNGEPNVVI